jgi:hypothetical protein
MLSEVIPDLQKLLVVLGYLCPGRKASAEGTKPCATSSELAVPQD